MKKNNITRVAIYGRLSEEDRNKSDPTQDSESIQNQKDMLENYAKEQNWLIYDFYMDDDWSGAYRNRPNFMRMLRDAENGCFDVVLCKTQSRFSRDMEVVEEYLHRKFPEWGIRFVSIADHADTEVRGNKKSRQINGLINEWYLEDLSENVRMVFDSKRRNGKYIGSYTPYGYLKSEKDRNLLVIDVEAAAVVKEIFKMRLEGAGCGTIATKLNEMGIPSPSLYKKLKNLPMKPIPETESSRVWHCDTVRTILKRETYAGNLVQGKMKKVSYKSKQYKRTPPETWIRADNTHEAIISPKDFMTVQQTFNNLTNMFRTSSNGIIDPLSGKVRCGRCHGAMKKMGAKNKSYYHCKTAMTSPNICELKTVQVEFIQAEILKNIKDKINLYASDSYIFKRVDTVSVSKQKLKKLQDDIRTLTAEKTRQEMVITSLYTDKAFGNITMEDFNRVNSQLKTKIDDLTNNISNIERQIQAIQQQDADETSVRDLIQKYKDVDELNYVFVDSFIEKIEITIEGKKHCEPDSVNIEIFWRF